MSVSPEPLIPSPYEETMFECLALIDKHVYLARHGANDITVGLNLVMASRALRTALIVYNDHIKERSEEAHV